MTTLETTVRRLRVTYCYTGSVWTGLPALADEISVGVHHRTQSGETDDQFLDRIDAEFQREFNQQAGEATGAGSFVFSAEFADKE